MQVKNPARNGGVLYLLNNPSFQLLRHDVTFQLFVEVDEIYNLACPASPIHYQNDPVQTTKVNVYGSINILGLAKRVKATILQASTSEVYGNPSIHPQVESHWGNVNPSGHGPVTMRGNDVLKRSFLTITGNMVLELR